MRGPNDFSRVWAEFRLGHARLACEMPNLPAKRRPWIDLRKFMLVAHDSATRAALAARLGGG
jgi:hypothetical protein